MRIALNYKQKPYSVDFAKPLDISIPLGNVKCFNAPDVVTAPFTSGDFVGSVKAGAPVNFFNISFNPHGNGTHTECLGHITKEQESINNTLKTFHFIAQVISVTPKNDKELGAVITLEEIVEKCNGNFHEAIVIRTLPNVLSKKTMDYSDKDPAYLASDAMAFLVEKGVQHLLIDLPSVDKEKDDGLLKGHHIFWGLDDEKIINSARKKCTITEMIYVKNEIEDGLYFLNLQIAPFELDASPSKPVLYKMNENSPLKNTENG